jgi:hypothetical protein
MTWSESAGELGGYTGMFLGPALILFALFMRWRKGIRRIDPTWYILGWLSIPGGFLLAFPLSNRDGPLAWFICFFVMYGGVLGGFLLYGVNWHKVPKPPSSA